MTWWPWARSRPPSPRSSDRVRAVVTARKGQHPTRLVVSGFVALIAVGTVLLSLPVAHADGRSPGLWHQLFTATSAATVTGLTSVAASEWSTFGTVVLLVLVQLGGFGIMTVGAVLVIVTSQRLGLRQRQLTQTEIGALTPGEIGHLLRTIAIVTIVIEGITAVVLALRFWQRGTESFGRSLWSGVFHSVMAFNNAGMSLYDDNFISFVGDPVVCLAVGLAVIIGGLGFPVLLELKRERRAARWSLHTKITLAASALLVTVGPVLVTAFEWTNRETLGRLEVGEKLVAGWFQGVSPRTAGFNSVDVGALRPSTLLVVVVLMFIGAGAASTGGGIKVTTFAVVGVAVWSEVRHGTSPTIFRRRIPDAAIRQALAVIALAIGSVVSATLGLLVLSEVEVFDAIFETFSAFGTVGLSLGVTTTLDSPALVVLALVMLAGRVGPTTFATAVVTRDSTRLYRYPEERPIIG